MNIVVASFVLSVFLLISSVGCTPPQAHLPSDKKAEAFFRAHMDKLADLIVAAQRDPKVSFVSSDDADPSHAAFSKLLRSIGAQFLRQRDGGIEIYVWGTGCAPCHDSYEGYAFISPGARMLEYSKAAQSLEDKALPKGKYAPVEEGTYIRALDQKWYVIRWECG
jgi:hypothetical protein